MSRTMHTSASIARFRQEFQERLKQPRRSEYRLNFHAAMIRQAPELPYRVRYAGALASALRQEPVRLYDREQLVGMLIQTGEKPGPDGEASTVWTYAEKNTRLFASGEIPPEEAFVASGGHIGWRFERILERGIAGIIEELEAGLARSRDEKTKAFFQSAIIAWRGVLAWNDAHVEALKAARKTAPAADHARLDNLIRIVSKVPRYPAETFHEALQSFHFQHLAVMFENPYGGNSPGRLDHRLGPYLERDLAAGTITREEAKYLIDELFMRFEERLFGQDGWVESIVTGGTAPDGASTVNTLSKLIVESFLGLNQTHPAVYPRFHPADPEDYRQLCLEYMLDGTNRCQIYNDPACLAALEASGLPPREALDYMAGGCMEISIQGRNCDLLFAVRSNVAKLFEGLICGEVSRLSDYPDFEALYTAFEAALRQRFAQLSKAIDRTGRLMAEYRPTPLLASLLDDCVDRGCDQHEGGARYYHYGFAPLGLTSVADSLSAIKSLVFEQRKVAAAELVTALNANFEHREILRRQLLNQPKFGEGDADADRMCQRVMTSVCTIAHATRNRFGGHLTPMIFNFIWTPTASCELKARADGSLAGAYIGHGMTPQPPAMRRELTTAMLSCTSLNFNIVSGGATTMWDFDSAWVTPELMRDVIKVFFDRGGMIMQGNTSDVGELEKALDDPDYKPNLIVRVGGFSAVFSSLAPEIKREIIKRHRHRG